MSEFKIQDRFLNAARKESATVNIHLSDGTMRSGIIASFDRFTILLQTAAPSSKSSLIYKQGILDIIPQQDLNITNTA